jgi:ribosomal protein L37AE/L43A
MFKILAFFVTFVFVVVATFLVIMFVKQARPGWCDQCGKNVWQTKWRWQKIWKCYHCSHINRTID